MTELARLLWLGLMTVVVISTFALSAVALHQAYRQGQEINLRLSTEAQENCKGLNQVRGSVSLILSYSVALRREAVARGERSQESLDALIERVDEVNETVLAPQPCKPVAPR